MIVGGDKLEYPYSTVSPTALIIKAKLIANNKTSDHKKYNSKFCAIYLKDYFLITPMEQAEYVRIHKKYITTNFMADYKLQDKIHTDE